MKKKELPQEYLEIVSFILNHPEFQRRKTYPHHGKVTVYDHCLAVSYTAYCIAKKMGVDYRSAAIGGLLHDFYDSPWQDDVKKKLFEKHGFVHARQAAENAWKYFPEYMDKKREDIILRHMFPLNIRPPKYIESWIVTMSDKYVSMEVIKDVKHLPRYIGFGPKKRKK